MGELIVEEKRGFGDGVAFGGANLSASGIGDDVEDDVIVGWVGIVAVAIPIVGRDMNLDIASPRHAIDAQLGIEEIGASIGIVAAWVKNLDDLACGCE